MVVQHPARKTLHRGSLCPQLGARGFLGGDFPLCLPAEGQRVAGWAHLSCLSRHTATITSRFPRMAISITAEMKVSSTIFSATPKPSLELGSTQKKKKKREKRKEKKVQLHWLGGDRPGNAEVPGRSAHFGERESSIPTTGAARLPSHPEH